MRRDPTLRVATLEECLRYGARGGHKALRARGLLPPIAGATGLAIDAQTLAMVGQTGSTSIVSTAFSPPAGALLLIAVGHTASVGLSAFSMTDSLAAHLSYSNPIAVVEGTNHAYAQFWLAQVGGSAPGSMQVTASWTGTSSFHDYIGVMVLNGAAASQVGAQANSASATSGAPTAPGAANAGAVTTSQANSWVFGFVVNFSNTTAPTIASGQTDVTPGAVTMRSAPAGDSAWIQWTSAPTPASGTSVNINDTAPSIEYAMVTLEILAASGGAAASAIFPVFLPRHRGPLRTGPFRPAPQQPYGALKAGQQLQQTFTAGLGFSGNVDNATTKTLTAGSSFAGSLAKATVHFLPPAVLSFAGSMARTTNKTFGAGLSFAGAITRNTVKALAAGLSFGGKLLKGTVHQLAAGLSFTGALAKNTTKTVTGALSFAGSFAATKIHQIIFTAALGFSGAVTKSTSRTLTGGLSFTGAVRRATARTLTAGLSFTGSLVKNTVRTLTGAVSFAGSLAATKIHQIIFTAALGFSGAVKKSTTRTLTGGLSFGGSLAKSTARTFTATVGFSGRIAKGITRKLSGGLSFVGNLISTHIGPSSAPPTICYPTTALIVPYASAPTVVPYASAPTVVPYATSTTLASFGGAYANTVMGDGPLAYWRLDEPSGTTAQDTTGNANNGTYENAPALGTPGLLIGDLDAAVAFNGSSQYVLIGNGAAVQLTTGSLECWVATTTRAAGANFRGFVGKNGAYFVGLDSSGNLCTFDFGGNAERSSGRSVVDGAAHHVVFTFAAGVANGSFLYLDGQLVLTTTVSVSTQANALVLAANNTTTQLLNGTLDEAAVYGFQLSAAQVARHYAAGTAPPAPIMALTTAGIASYNATGAITGHDTAGTLVKYTSGVTHFNTCSD